MEKYLVVCLGSIGRRHLKNLRSLRPHAKIAVLRLSSAAYPPPPAEADFQFSDIHAATDFSPTAAIICSPANEHANIAKILLERGISVLIEKPLAHEIEGVDALISLANVKKLTLMTAYNLRYLPSLRSVHRLIHSGAIGHVYAARAEVGQYLPDWRPGKPYQDTVSAQKSLGGGALLELSHELDYIYWLFGLPERISASGGHFSDLEIDVEDMVSMNLEYDSPKRLVNVHVDFLQRSISRTCKFIGSEGTLLWDGMANTVSMYSTATREWQAIATEPMTDRNQMYLEELSHFLECIEQKVTPFMAAHEGKDVLKMIKASEKSMQTKTTIHISHE